MFCGCFFVIKAIEKLVCGEKTFLKKGSFPHTPFSKNFRRNYFYCANKSNSNLFYIALSDVSGKTEAALL